MTAWLEIAPSAAPSFHRRGWKSAAAFLAWTGILFNRHRDRQVARVTFDNQEHFFLKQESNVGWRTRFRNAWHGFGFVSTDVREGKTLQAARAAGIGCPEVVACGEDGRQAFVLLREAAGMTELRDFLQALACPNARQRLAVALGRELAKMHDAGFDHPDLFAKHVFVAPARASFRFCILDWQRTQQRRRVAWRQRCRDLGVLDATLHATLASDRFRLRCLRAYVQALARANRPPLGRLARRIRREAARLRQNHKLREIGQLPIPAEEQQFASLQAGRLLVVRAYYEALGGELPAWLQQLGEPETPEIGDNAVGTWDLPPLAHTLFRLHRFGIAAPRLLAARRTSTGVALHLTPIAAIPFAQALAQALPGEEVELLRQAHALIHRLQEAGYRRPAAHDWFPHFGIDHTNGNVMLTDVACLHAMPDRLPLPQQVPALERQTSV